MMWYGMAAAVAASVSLVEATMLVFFCCFLGLQFRISFAVLKYGIDTISYGVYGTIIFINRHQVWYGRVPCRSGI